MAFNLDVETMTLEEIELLETISGIGIAEFEENLSNDQNPKASFLIAATFIVMRRENPTVELADVRKLPLTAAMALLDSQETISGKDESSSRDELETSPSSPSSSDTADATTSS